MGAGLPQRLPVLRRAGWRRRWQRWSTSRRWQSRRARRAAAPSNIRLELRRCSLLKIAEVPCIVGFCCLLFSRLSCSTRVRSRSCCWSSRKRDAPSSSKPEAVLLTLFRFRVLMLGVRIALRRRLQLANHAFRKDFYWRCTCYFRCVSLIAQICREASSLKVVFARVAVRCWVRRWWLCSCCEARMRARGARESCQVMHQAFGYCNRKLHAPTARADATQQRDKLS